MMGNETSVAMDDGASSNTNRLQTQGQKHMWTVYLQQGSESGEGVCSFVRKPGTGDVADLCAAAVDVSQRVVLTHLSLV